LGLKSDPDPRTQLTLDPVLDLLKPLPSDIPGGEIIRDPGLGVLCDSAAVLVENISPIKAEEELTAAFHLAQKHLNSVGLVGVHDASVFPRTLRLFQKSSPYSHQS
jgi:predicted amidohydrolase YtcJ